MLKLDRRDWIALLALTALAAGLRFYKLGAVPPGFQFDEAFNALDAAGVLAGDRPLFLPLNGGREVAYTYFQAALASVLGLNLFTLRLASALAGIAAVPLAYLLLRGLLTVDSRRVAAFTSLVLAISLWHLHFSHYGIRVILMPVIISGVIGFFWLGVKRGRAWPYLLSGALAGLGVWTHPTGRLLPLVLAGFVAWLWWQHPEQRRLRWPSPAAGLALTGLAAFVVFLPLGLEFVRHPDFFLGHPQGVSIFAERVHGGSPLLALLANTGRVLGMFSVRGDAEWIHNLAGRPVFDPLLSIPFLIGLVLWVGRLVRRGDPDRDALLLLGLWSLVMLLPSVFSDMAPNYSRTLPSLPAVFVAAGLGLAWILAFTERRGLALVGQVAVAVILLVSAGLAARDYFLRFPQAPETYYAYDVDKLDALSFLEQATDEHQVYLSQLWAEHATIDFLRQGGPIKSLDTSDTVVLPPPGRSALYAFPWEQAERASRLLAQWPAASLDRVKDRLGNPLLATVTLPAEAAASIPETGAPLARFVDGPSLLSSQVLADSGEIVLAWQAEQPISRSLTSFVHLLDGNGQVVGQADKLPGNGSYPTTAWTPGERVFESYRPVLDSCVEGEPLRVAAGWYDLSAGAQPLPRADAPGVLALAGEFTPALSSRPAGDLQLEHILDAPAGAGLALYGYTLAGDELQPGSPLTLDLVWRGQPAHASLPLAVILAHGQEQVLLWEGALAPGDAQWQPGQVICRRLRLRLPADLPPGDYQLQVDTGGQELPLTALSLASSTRRFDVPGLAQPLDAVLDDQVRLLGSELARGGAGQPLEVTLIWQAIQAPPSSYTVFVHLLDADGRLVAQSDALPAGDYATNRWLPGEVVIDRHTLALPEDLAPVTYQVVAGLYDPITGQRLPAWSSTLIPYQGDAIPVGEVSLP